MKREKQLKETDNKQSKTFYNPPFHEEETLRQDVERKRDEIKNSTIGGF